MPNQIYDVIGEIGDISRQDIGVISSLAMLAVIGIYCSIRNKLMP